MKVILLVTSLLFSALSYAQNNTSTPLIKKGNPINRQTIVEPKNNDDTFDGTFYIITDKEAPENFLQSNISKIVSENRNKIKDVKLKFGDRSTIVIFSEKKIKKENFEPVKTMIQLK